MGHLSFLIDGFVIRSITIRVLGVIISCLSVRIIRIR